MGYNVFAYCANNPVACFDPTGEFVISTVIISLVAGAVLGGTAGGIIGNMYANSNGYDGTEKLACIITGVIAGGLLFGTIGYYAAPAIASMTGVGGISVTASGVSTVAATGYSFGKLGTLIVNSGQQLIDWGRTTQHGMDRMAERGVTREMVELWAKTGKALQQAGDKILYITKQGAVVINKLGQVITAYTSADFDEGMKAVIEILFGK